MMDEAPSVADLLVHTNRITLQLSNMCNMTHLHADCPTSVFKTKHILPKAVVCDVIDTLAEAKFNSHRKWLAWHVYNDPLIDPRLMWFTEYARKRLDKIKILLFTNGWYLNETLASELIDAGISQFNFSAYSDAALERLREIETVCAGRAAVKIGRWHHLYAWVIPGKPGHGSKQPCSAPLNDLNVRASGKLGLCCLDWDESWTGGDVAELGFERALREGFERMKRLYDALRKSRRELARCQACPKHR